MRSLSRVLSFGVLALVLSTAGCSTVGTAGRTAGDAAGDTAEAAGSAAGTAARGAGNVIDETAGAAEEDLD